jgi:hypothetical protein
LVRQAANAEGIVRTFLFVRFLRRQFNPLLSAAQGAENLNLVAGFNWNEQIPCLILVDEDSDVLPNLVLLIDDPKANSGITLIEPVQKPSQSRRVRRLREGRRSFGFFPCFPGIVRAKNRRAEVAGPGGDQQRPRLSRVGDKMMDDMSEKDGSERRNARLVLSPFSMNAPLRVPIRRVTDPEAGMGEEIEEGRLLPEDAGLFFLIMAEPPHGGWSDRRRGLRRFPFFPL